MGVEAWRVRRQSLPGHDVVLTWTEALEIDAREAAAAAALETDATLAKEAAWSCAKGFWESGAATRLATTSFLLSHLDGRARN